MGGKVELVAGLHYSEWPVGPARLSLYTVQCSTAGVQYRVQCTALCCNSDELVVGSKSCDPLIQTKAIKT